VRKPFVLMKSFPNYVQLGRSILEIFVKQPVKVCSSLLNLCGCTAQKKLNQKAMKSSFACDIEGDYYPDDFAPRMHPEQTKEEDRSPSMLLKQGANLKANHALLIIETGAHNPGPESDE
jgi:hypothetical protein